MSGAILDPKVSVQHMRKWYLFKVCTSSFLIRINITTTCQKCPNTKLRPENNEPCAHHLFCYCNQLIFIASYSDALAKYCLVISQTPFKEKTEGG